MPYKNKELEAAYKEKSREIRMARKRAFYKTPHGLALKRAWYQRHKAEILQKRKDYRESNTEKIAARKKAHYEIKKTHILNQQREYKKNNHEKTMESVRRCWSKNRESYNRTKREYYAKNKQKYLEWTSRRRAIQIGATAGDPSQIVEFIYSVRASKDTRCAYCGIPLFEKPMHIDHIIPLSRGGQHSVGNLCASCPDCNKSKGSKMLSEWKNQLVKII